MDTQAWLWAAVAPERFSKKARALVQNDSNELLPSAASAYHEDVSLGRSAFTCIARGPLPIMTADPEFKAYQVEVISA